MVIRGKCYAISYYPRAPRRWKTSELSMLVASVFLAGYILGSAVRGGLIG